MKHLPLEVDVSSCIPHGRVQIGMPKPLTDGSEVDAGFEQTDGGRVPDRMGVNTFVAHRGCGVAAGGNVFPQEIANSKACQRPAPCIGEKRRVSRIVRRRRTPVQILLQELGCRWPDRTLSHLVALAPQPDLARRIEQTFKRFGISFVEEPGRMGVFYPEKLDAEDVEALELKRKRQ